MKLIPFIIFCFVSLQSFSQINRYTQYTPARYQPMSFSEMAALPMAKSRADDVASQCQQFIKAIKAESYGTTYSSPTSDAISKVSFHTLTMDFETYHFAIVCFKSEYSYECSEYLYQVGPTTETNYSQNYLTSAGNAFWQYIQPFHENLKCSPNLE